MPSRGQGASPSWLPPSRDPFVNKLVESGYRKRQQRMSAPPSKQSGHRPLPTHKTAAGSSNKRVVTAGESPGLKLSTTVGEMASRPAPVCHCPVPAEPANPKSISSVDVGPGLKGSAGGPRASHAPKTVNEIKVKALQRRHPVPAVSQRATLTSVVGPPEPSRQTIGAPSCAMPTHPARRAVLSTKTQGDPERREGGWTPCMSTVQWTGGQEGSFRCMSPTAHRRDVLSPEQLRSPPTVPASPPTPLTPVDPPRPTSSDFTRAADTLPTPFAALERVQLGDAHALGFLPTTLAEGEGMEHHWDSKGFILPMGGDGRAHEEGRCTEDANQDPSRSDAAPRLAPEIGLTVDYISIPDQQSCSPVSKQERSPLTPRHHSPLQMTRTGSVVGGGPAMAATPSTPLAEASSGSNDLPSIELRSLERSCVEALSSMTTASQLAPNKPSRTGTTPFSSSATYTTSLRTRRAARAAVARASPIASATGTVDSSRSSSPGRSRNAGPSESPLSATQDGQERTRKRSLQRSLAAIASQTTSQTIVAPRKQLLQAVSPTSSSCESPTVSISSCCSSPGSTLSLPSSTLVTASAATADATKTLEAQHPQFGSTTPLSSISGSLELPMTCASHSPLVTKVGPSSPSSSSSTGDNTGSPASGRVERYRELVRAQARAELSTRLIHAQETAISFVEPRGGAENVVDSCEVAARVSVSEIRTLHDLIVAATLAQGHAAARAEQVDVALEEVRSEVRRAEAAAEMARQETHRVNAAFAASKTRMAKVLLARRQRATCARVFVAWSLITREASRKVGRPGQASSPQTSRCSTASPGVASTALSSQKQRTPLAAQTPSMERTPCMHGTTPHGEQNTPDDDVIAMSRLHGKGEKTQDKPAICRRSLVLGSPYNLTADAAHLGSTERQEDAVPGSPTVLALATELRVDDTTADPLPIERWEHASSQALPDRMSSSRITVLIAGSLCGLLAILLLALSGVVLNVGIRVPDPSSNPAHLGHGLGEAEMTTNQPPQLNGWGRLLVGAWHHPLLSALPMGLKYTHPLRQSKRLASNSLRSPRGGLACSCNGEGDCLSNHGRGCLVRQKEARARGLMHEVCAELEERSARTTKTIGSNGNE